MGVGIDLVEIARISLDEKFINLVFSKKEQSLAETKTNKKEYYASRWACKEAFLKANQLGLGDMKLNEIEVFNEDSGKPFIIYHQTKYENVSISHEKDYAIAIVII